MWSQAIIEVHNRFPVNSRVRNTVGVANNGTQQTHAGSQTRPKCIAHGYCGNLFGMGLTTADLECGLARGACTCQYH
jgi:hypothetical protein